MTTESIHNPHLFRVLNEVTNEHCFGCDQQWYSTEWQRISGCGPAVASNIVFYLTHRALSAGEAAVQKSACASLMEEVWEYVTPTSQGIPTTRMFSNAVRSYMSAKGMSFEYATLDIPQDAVLRLGLTEVLDFLQRALAKDAPVAFLNLCNGDEKNLDEWHWVTIISLEYLDGERQIFVNILDEGIIKRIDLTLWYDTTTLGGGFVYFTA